MRVVPQLIITDAMLTSTPVPEPDTGENAWNALTAYNVGDTVYLPATHDMYRRRVAGTTATSPDQDTDNWTHIGKTHRWKMFDLYRNSVTASASPFTIELTPGTFIDAIVAAGMANCDELEITIARGATVVYNHVESLIQNDSDDWEEFFFVEPESKSSVAFFDLPSYSDAVITLTFSSANGQAVSIGAVMINLSQFIGYVENDSQLDAVSYSSVNVDSYGNTELIPRPNAARNVHEIDADADMVDKLIRLQRALDAVPACYVAVEETSNIFFQAFLIIGTYKQFRMRRPNCKQIKINLELTEIIG